MARRRQDTECRKDRCMVVEVPSDEAPPNAHQAPERATEKASVSETHDSERLKPRWEEEGLPYIMLSAVTQDAQAHAGNDIQERGVSLV
jgi:hypothetical protein